MQTDSLRFFPMIIALQTIFLTVRKHLSRSEANSPEDRLLRDLERLALLSPHLLEDLGFACDNTAGAPCQTVWRRGNLRVAVAYAAPSATASID